MSQVLDKKLKSNIDKFKMLNTHSNDIKIINALYLTSSTLKISNKMLTSFLESNYDNHSDLVGYTIKNVSKNTIKHIAIPTYLITKDKYKGKISYIDLKPGRTLEIPTKWLILLLSRIEYAFSCKNGYFYKLNNVDGNIDKIFSNYRFVGEDLTPKNIGAYFIKSNSTELLQQYKLYFGYLCNTKSFKDIKIKTKTSKFLAVLLNEIY